MDWAWYLTDDMIKGRNEMIYVSSLGTFLLIRNRMLYYGTPPFGLNVKRKNIGQWTLRGSWDVV